MFLDYFILYEENPKELTENLVKQNVFTSKSVPYKWDVHLTFKGPWNVYRIDYIKHKEDIHKLPRVESTYSHSLATVKYNHNWVKQGKQHTTQIN